MNKIDAETIERRLREIAAELRGLKPLMESVDSRLEAIARRLDRLDPPLRFAAGHEIEDDEVETVFH